MAGMSGRRYAAQLLSATSVIALTLSGVPALAETIDVTTAQTAPITSVVDSTGIINITSTGSVTTSGGGNHAIQPYMTPGLGPWTVNVDGMVKVLDVDNTVYGIWLRGGGVVDVRGGGSVEGSRDGIVIEGGPATVTNAGLIGGSWRAVSIMGGSVTNYGTMHGGVTFQTGTGTLVNNGIISSNVAVGATGFGINMNAGGTITNNGDILFNNIGQGMWTHGDVTFHNTSTGTLKAEADSGYAPQTTAVLFQNGNIGAINDGTILGRDLGMYFYQGTANLTNSGSITGQSLDAVNMKPVGVAQFTQTGGELQGGRHGLSITTSSNTTIAISGGQVVGGNVDNAGIGINIAGSGPTTLDISDASVSGVAAAIQGGSGQFDVQLLDGAVIDGLVNLGTGNSSLKMSTGAAVVGDIEASAGTSGLTLNGTGAGSYDGSFSGFDTAAVTGGRWVLGGNSTFANAISVGNGGLIANGIITGDVNVNAGGLLGGSGAVGNVVLTGDAVVAPGNSVGTLTVNGDVTFGANTRYEVEVDPASSASDLLQVTGIVHLAGAPVLHVGNTGSYRPSASYTIVKAGTIDGTFGSVTSNFAFLDPTLSYDANTVTLSLLRNDIEFADVADTPNQKAVAGALNGFGNTNPVYQEIAGSSASQAQASFDSASGELHATEQYVIDQTFSLFRNALTPSGGGTPGSGKTVKPLGYGSGLETAGLAAIDMLAAQPPAGQDLWVRPMGGRGTVGADGNAAQLDWWAAGLAGGYEAHGGFGNGEASLGLGIGYLANGGSVPERESSSSGQGGYAGVYGGWTDGTLSVSGRLAYGATRVATTRHIAVGALTQTAEASYWTHSAGVDLEGSYAVPLNDQVTLSPTGTLSAGWSGHDAASETGAGALNAMLDAASFHWLDAGLGLQVAYRADLASGGRVTLTGRALWEHGFGDAAPDQTLALAGGGSPYTVRGPDAARDRLKLGTGIGFSPVPGTTLSLNYDGTLAPGMTSHAVVAGLQATF